MISLYLYKRVKDYINMSNTLTIYKLNVIETFTFKGSPHQTLVVFDPYRGVVFVPNTVLKHISKI